MNEPLENSDPRNRRMLAVELLQKARLDLQNGDRREARRRAEQAASLAPEIEDSWLILAALASPRASVAYLQKALEINPSSQRAQKGLQWALQRFQQEGKRAEPPVFPLPPSTAAVEPDQTAVPKPSPDAAPQPAPAHPPVPPGSQPAPPILKRSMIAYKAGKKRKAAPIPSIFYFAFYILLVSLIFFSISMVPYIPQIVAGLPPGIADQLHSLGIVMDLQIPSGSSGSTGSHPAEEIAGLFVAPQADPATLEPTSEPNPTFTAIPTEMPTAVPTEAPTYTPVPTDPPAPTETPVPTETATPEPTLEPAPTLAPPLPTEAPKPTKKPKKKAVVAGPGVRPAGVSLNDRWIDVDLSSQVTYAMQGDQIVRSFVVSTGRWPTVTVTGVFKIYVKYRKANMSGTDYFLPDVPNVMYFFKGYGLHGTYWHNNFGTPMSHGCVNLSPADSSWLFDFASVGTVVSVHE